jgi:hypothetical protein
MPDFADPKKRFPAQIPCIQKRVWVAQTNRDHIGENPSWPAHSLQTAAKQAWLAVQANVILALAQDSRVASRLFKLGIEKTRNPGVCRRATTLSIVAHKGPVANAQTRRIHPWK